MPRIFVNTSKMLKKKKPSARSNARAIAKLRNMSEVKYHYTSSTYQTRVGGRHYFGINALQQGDLVGNRIGNSVDNLSLNSKLQFGVNLQDLVGTPTDVIWGLTFFSTKVRVILIYNTSNDCTNGIIEAEIFETLSSIQETLYCQFNKDFVGKGKKYRILYDKFFYLSQLGEMEKQLSISRRILGKTHYTDSTGTGSDILDKRYTIGVVLETDTDVGIRSVLNYRDA